MNTTTVAVIGGVGLLGLLGVGAIFMLSGSTPPAAQQPTVIYQSAPAQTGPQYSATKQSSPLDNLSDMGMRFVSGLAGQVGERAMGAAQQQLSTGLDQFFGAPGSNFGAGTFGY